MRKFITLSLFINSVVFAHALVINEIMSNPIGDDGGREWIELYNDSANSVEASSFTISIKGGSFIPVTPVSGGLTISPYGYAIIGSTVAATTRFTSDYPSYSGPLFKSTMNLVNTGVTSVELKSQGVTIDALVSYTAAKEGDTYARINGSFLTGIPTPGEENKEVVSPPEDATTSPTGSQATIPQMAPPSTDIILYLPSEKVVVAGAPALFSAYALTRSGKSIDAMTYTWSFGDGGERVGGTTTYRYFYPGRYVAQVEGTNSLVIGNGRMTVRVVSPDISISTIATGKYGQYIDITNPNKYDLDISGWKISIDGALFSFPKNTLLAEGVTHVPGLSMGFASTTVASSTIIKLIFPNMDEVVRVYQGAVIPQTEVVPLQKNTLVTIRPFLQKPFIKQSHSTGMVNFSERIPSSTSTSATTSRVAFSQNKKDTRIGSFLKSLFK